MANQLLTRQEITWDSLEILENRLVIVPNFYRDLDKEFGKKGGKIGDTIFVRKPPRFIGRDGQAYSPEGLTDTEVPITINQQSGVDFEFSSAEKYLSLDDFRRRYLEPAMISLSNKLDYRCASMAVLNTANFVGSVGTTPGLSGSDAFNTYANARQLLFQMGFDPKGGEWSLAINALAERGWLDYTKQFYNPADSLSKQWKTGQVNNALGLKWFVDENINAQTIGALNNTAYGPYLPEVTGANQTGTSINTKGWLGGASTGIANVLLPGDVISFAGVYAVNPQSRQSTGVLQQFVVQAAVTSANNATGTATISILPAIVPSGQFQNVSASPADGALISVYGTAASGQGALGGLTTLQGLLWDKEAYAFTSFPGDVPEGVDMGYEDRSKEIGVSLRFVRIYDGYRDQWINRFDVYYGIAPLYMEGGVRISLS
jgi:hypothetical protein